MIDREKLLNIAGYKVLNYAEWMNLSNHDWERWHYYQCDERIVLNYNNLPVFYPDTDSMEFLMGIVKRKCFKWHFDGSPEQSFHVLYVANGDGTLRRVIGEGATDIESLKSALLKLE